MAMGRGDPIVIKVSASEEPEQDDARPPMARSASLLWDWNQSNRSSLLSSPMASREASQHGGDLFGVTSPSGTTKMKRNVSFSDNLPTSPRSSRRDSWVWDWSTASPPASKPASREGSLKGGNFFGLGGGATSPTGSGSWVWNWSTASPPASRPASRDSSLKGGNAFGGPSPDGMKRSQSWVWDWSTASAPTSKPASRPASRDSSLKGGNAFGMPSSDGLKRSLSLNRMWDWGADRQSPDSSEHGGNDFTPDVSDAPSSALPFEPPKALTKNLSMGSFLFDWGAQRVSPPHTRPPTRPASPDAEPSVCDGSR